MITVIRVLPYLAVIGAIAMLFVFLGGSRIKESQERKNEQNKPYRKNGRD